MDARSDLPPLGWTCRAVELWITGPAATPLDSQQARMLAVHVSGCARCFAVIFDGSEGGQVSANSLGDEMQVTHCVAVSPQKSSVLKDHEVE